MFDINQWLTDRFIVRIPDSSAEHDTTGSVLINPPKLIYSGHTYEWKYRTSIDVNRW